MLNLVSFIEASKLPYNAEKTGKNLIRLQTVMVQVDYLILVLLAKLPEQR